MPADRQESYHAKRQETESARQALHIVILAPRKVAEITSEAMLFDIGCSDDIVPFLAMPEREAPNGTKAG